MSVKTYIISLSLTGAAAALGCWMLIGPAPSDAAAGQPVTKTAGRPARVLTKDPSAGQRTPKPKSASPAASGTPLASASARNALPPPHTEPSTPEARAARVEQEANHELRRLVPLLNLDESQQEKIFATLARNSRYWSPEMQIAAPGAASTGKRAPLTEGTSGIFLPVTESPAATVPDNPVAATAPPPGDPITIGAPSPGATDDSRINDPMSEIMSLLTPEQQQVLLEAETDKTAWWAEILPQILPSDDIPDINGGIPGDTQEYEGSETLE